MQLFIALIIFLSASVKGVDLLLFAEDGVCNTGKEDYVACPNLPHHMCCQSPTKSFCGASILQNVNGSTEHFVMGEGVCDRNGLYTSIQDSTGLSMCISIPVDDSSDRCSSYWDPPTDQDGVSGGLDLKMECREPDKMGYHDGTAMRRIHLPDGTFWNAVQHYREKNYRELANFPTWNGSNSAMDG